MTQSGTFPKVDGDILYADDTNLMASNASEKLLDTISTAYARSGTSFGNFNTLFESFYQNTYFDGFINNTKIGTNTGSFVSGNGIGLNYLTINGYEKSGGIVNGDFTGSVTTGWSTGSVAGGSVFTVNRTTAWTSGTGYSGMISGTLASASNGYGYFSQNVSLQNLTGFRLDFYHKDTDHGETYKIYASGTAGSQIFYEKSSPHGVPGGSVYGLNTTFYLNKDFGTGSIAFIIRAGRTDGDTDARAVLMFFDNIKAIRSGSANDIADSYRSSGLLSQSNQMFKTVYPLVNGSFGIGAGGSYYASADNGTTWDSVTNRRLHNFSTPGSNFKFRIDLYSNGSYLQYPKIYSYGASLTQS